MLWAALVPWQEQMKAWAALVTAVAAVAGAFIGAMWAVFRYRRESPHIPRVNAGVSATAAKRGSVHYLTWEVKVEHISGGAVQIHDGSKVNDERAPSISIDAHVPVLTTGFGLTKPVLRRQTLAGHAELAAGEIISDSGLAAFAGDAVAFELRVDFTMQWGRNTWGMMANCVVPAQPEEP